MVHSTPQTNEPSLLRNIISVLVETGLTALVTGTTLILNAKSISSWAFPPAPFDGLWEEFHGNHPLHFCFVQENNFVWGEFQSPKRASKGNKFVVYAVVDGTIKGNSLEVEYSRTRGDVFDWGKIFLSYRETEHGKEQLTGHWKSERFKTNPLLLRGDSDFTTLHKTPMYWSKRRGLVRLNRVSDKCDLQTYKWPAPVWPY